MPPTWPTPRSATTWGAPPATRLAEDNLRRTRRAREGALMSGIAAGDALMQTAAVLGEKRQELAQVEKLRTRGSQRGEQLLSILQDPRATERQKQEALGVLLRLGAAGAVYEQAVRSGDPTLMR